MVKVDPDERKQLLALKPDVYYVTDHYTNPSALLVRLAKIDRRALTTLLKKAAHFLS
jgi:hypothetical protein